MFNLIITVISIALVAVLAIATIYYGGSVWSRQGDEAAAVRVLNEAAQVKGAVELYRNDHAGSAPADLDALVPTYLKSIPTNTTSTWTVVGEHAVSVIGPSVAAAGVTETEIAQALASCMTINEKLGLGSQVYSCLDPAVANVQVCCDTELPAP